jgi:hypothetical protein
VVPPMAWTAAYGGTRISTALPGALSVNNRSVSLTAAFAAARSGTRPATRSANTSATLTPSPYGRVILSVLSLPGAGNNTTERITGRSGGCGLQSCWLRGLVVAFGVVYNNARISLAERARELATLRVIGFSEREVGAVLITELTVLALMALPLGLLLGTGFAQGIVSAVNTETVRLPVVFTLHNYAFATMIVAVASTISALLVLRRLKQLNLVSALKAPE